MNKGLNIIDHILLLVGLLVSSHHHLAELVKVHGARPILVQLLQDACPSILVRFAKYRIRKNILLMM